MDSRTNEFLEKMENDTTSVVLTHDICYNHVSKHTLMDIIAMDNTFAYHSVNVTMKEKKLREEYQLTYSLNDIEEFDTLNIIARDESHGRLLRKMYKNPQHIYAAIITRKTDDEIVSNLIFDYEPGAAEKSVLKLIDNIIDSYIEHKGFTSIHELMKVVNKFNKETQARSEIMDNIHKYDNKFL